MAIPTPSPDNGTPMGEMNTTPLIDVMLVLLIMFIITLPIQTHAVEIDLPREAPPGPLSMTNRVVVTERGAILWNGTPTSFIGLAHRLERMRVMSPQPELQFQPDAQARFALVDQTLAVIKRSGIEGIGFVGNERYGNDF